MSLLACSNSTSSSVMPRPYRDALARYEAIRPMLTARADPGPAQPDHGAELLATVARSPALSAGRVLGLIDRRTLPHPRGRPPIETRLPQYIQQRLVRLALAHPFTARELARIVQECYHQPVDYRGIQRVLARRRLSPAALQRHPQAGAAGSPPAPASSAQQLTLPLEPTRTAQRLGPWHWAPSICCCRFRT